VEMQRGDSVEEQLVLARGTTWRSNRWRLEQRGQCGGVEDGRHGLRGFSGRRWWHRVNVEDWGVVDSGAAPRHGQRGRRGGVDDVEGEVMDLDPAEAEAGVEAAPRRGAAADGVNPRMVRGRPATAVPEGGPGVSGGGPAAPGRVAAAVGRGVWEETKRCAWEAEGKNGKERCGA
jgi:hypothetical protein